MKFLLFFLLFPILTAEKNCETAECVKLAKNMKSVMNKSTNPCDDFYEYACGKFDPENRDLAEPILNDSKVLQEILKEFKPSVPNEKLALSIVEKCMNDDESVNIDTFMKDFWDNTDDLTQLIIEITKLDPTNGGLFKIEAKPDRPSPSFQYLINLSAKEESPKKTMFNWRPLKEVKSKIKFMNVTEYLYQVLPEGERHYGVFESAISVEVSFLEINEKVSKLGTPAVKQILYSQWKQLLQNLADTQDGHLPKCVLNMITLLPGTMNFFLSNILEKENIDTANDLFAKLIIEATEMIEESEWPSHDGKLRMLKKLNAVVSSIPAELQNQNINDRYINNIDEQSYLSLVRNVLIMKSEQTYYEYWKQDKITFTTTPFDLTAIYSAPKHQITVAPFLLKYPIVSQQLPEWSVLASFGFIVGREIGHMFDPTFFWYDAYYDVVSVDEQTGRKYTEISQWLVQKYNKYTLPDGEHIDGQLTVNENFADQFGIQLAWRLYKKLSTQNLSGLFKHSTIDQQFFLRMSNVWCSADATVDSLEDVHSSAKVRVNGIVTNLPEFAKTFKCDKSTKMGSEKKCELF